MQIDQETWEWLDWLGYGPDILVGEEEEAIVLIPEFVDDLLQGHAFKDLCQRLAKNLDLPLEKEQRLNQVTDGFSIEERSRNFDIIFEFWADLGYDLGEEVKRALLENDETTLGDLLADVSRIFGLQDQQEELEYTGDDLKGRDKPRMENQYNEEGNTTMAVAHPGVKGFKSEDIDRLNLVKLKPDSDPSSSTSIPEILVLTLSRGFNMKIIEVKK